MLQKDDAMITALQWRSGNVYFFITDISLIITGFMPATVISVMSSDFFRNHTVISLPSQIPKQISHGNQQTPHHHHVRA
jgi:hypothetical protein